MDDQQAADALFTAVQEDTGRTTEYDAGIGAAPGEFSAAQTEESKQAAPVTSEETNEESAATSESTAEATAEEPELDSFTRLDPNTIPEALKPWYQSMQADYTRKMQQVSEQRKQVEALANTPQEEVAAAMTLFQNLQNPQWAVSFYEQLGGTLGQMGLTPAQQQAVAAAQASNPEMHQAAQQAAVQQVDPTDDPEAYFHQRIAQVDQRLAAWEQRLQAQEEAANRERFSLALAGEVARQEEFLKESNPHWQNSDWDAVYKIADHFDGNLVAAANVWESAVADRVNRMIAAKESVALDHGSTAGMASGATQTAPSFGDNLDAAHLAAQERLRQIEAAS